MPEFVFKAVNEQGKIVRGKLVTRSESMVEKEVKSRGLSLISCQPTSTAFVWHGGSRIKRRDIIEMFIPWLAMEKAGVPLLDAMKDSLDEIENPALQEIARQMATEMEEGDSLVEVAARHPKIFDQMSLGILRAGTESGRLDKSFEFLIRHHSWLDSLRKTVTQMMLEPGILLAVIILFIILMFSFVVPQIMKTVAMFHVPMPLPTRLMFHLNDFFKDYGLVVVLLLVGISMLLPVLYIKWPAFRFKFDAWKLKWPVFGRLNRMIVSSRFSHHMSAMFRSGITLIDGMEIASKAVGNAFVEREILGARDKIMEGESIYAAMGSTDVFSPMVLRMIKVGEDSGNLDETLTYVSEYYDDEVPRRIARAFTLLTPLITIVLGVVVLMIALSVFMPMLDMIDKIHTMRH